MMPAQAFWRTVPFREFLAVGGRDRFLIACRQIVEEAIPKLSLDILRQRRFIESIIDDRRLGQRLFRQKSFYLFDHDQFSRGSRTNVFKRLGWMR